METPFYRLQTTTKLLEDLKYSSPLISSIFQRVYNNVDYSQSVNHSK